MSPKIVVCLSEAARHSSSRNRNILICSESESELKDANRVASMRSVSCAPSSKLTALCCEGEVKQCDSSHPPTTWTPFVTSKTQPGASPASRGWYRSKKQGLEVAVMCFGRLS